MLIAVFGNEYQNLHFSDLERLFAGLATIPDVHIVIEGSYAGYLTSNISLPDSAEILAHPGPVVADLVLSIGGDGTFLRTAAAVAPTEVPIMGINSGHLGYLSAADIADVEAIVEDIRSGNFVTEPRSMLQVSTSGSFDTLTLYALNEVAILKKDTASMISACTTVNGEFLANYQADGLVISTPTGSTGYNLSAGGPIVAPSAPNWIISPVAAHSLTMRPLVVSDSAVIEVITHSRAESFRLSVDGRSVALAIPTPLVIRKAPFVTNLVRRRGLNFADTLRAKLLWGVDNYSLPCRP